MDRDMVKEYRMRGESGEVLSNTLRIKMPNCFEKQGCPSIHRSEKTEREVRSSQSPGDRFIGHTSAPSISPFAHAYRSRID